MCAFFKSILFFRFNESFQKGLFHSLATVNCDISTTGTLNYFAMQINYPNSMWSMSN